MDRLFFSKENAKIIYGILQKKTQSSLQYNIDNDPRFQKELVDIMKAIYQQKGTFNLPPNISAVDASRFLSQKVINVALHYFRDSINKMNGDVDVIKRDSNTVKHVNVVSDRPMASSMQPQVNVSNSYENIIKNRSLDDNRNTPAAITFADDSQKQFTSNEDVSKRFQDLSNSRQQEYESVNPSANNPDTISQIQKFPESLSTQQNFINNPSSSEINNLLEQQKSIQDKINNFQRNISSSNSENMSRVYHENASTPSDLSRQFNTLESNYNEKQFKAPPQANAQYFSESEPSKNIMSNQFKSIIDEAVVNTVSEMEPDNEV